VNVPRNVHLHIELSWWPTEGYHNLWLCRAVVTDIAERQSTAGITAMRARALPAKGE
jgi:hypothetical protein